MMPEKMICGQEQQIKIEIMKDIQEGKPPIEILYRCIEYIGKKSGEPTFSDVAKENIRSVYGIALGEPVLLQKELEDVIQRGKKLKEAYKREGETEENKRRIEFALIAHRKRAAQLKELLKNT